MATILLVAFGGLAQVGMIAFFLYSAARPMARPHLKALDSLVRKLGVESAARSDAFKVRKLLLSSVIVPEILTSGATLLDTSHLLPIALVVTGLTTTAIVMIWLVFKARLVRVGFSW